MKTPLAVTEAAYVMQDISLVRLKFNDNTVASIYLEDGSPRIYAHDLLDAWLADGNEIAQSGL